MKKENFFNIEKNTTTFLKGIAILFVILGHMGYIYNAGSWGVSLFLILSGYGIFKSYQKNGLKKYFSKKIKKIFLPYVLVTIFVLLYNYIKFKISKKTIIFSLLGIDFGFICDGTMWYISYIFIQYIIFFIVAFAFKKIKRENIKSILIILSCFILSYIIYKLNIRYVIWRHAAGTFLYRYSFGLGLTISFLSNYKISVKIKKIFLTFASFGLLFVILCLYNCVTTNSKYFIYANSMPILLILLNELKLVKFKNKTINFIGNISFDIYLWEAFFLNIEKNLFSPLHYQLLMDICTIIICILFSQMYKKLFIDSILFNETTSKQNTTD